MTYLIRDFLNRPVAQRRKFTRKECEEVSEMASLAESLFVDALARAPAASDHLMNVFVKPFQDGADTTLYVELQCLLHERPDNVGPDSISVLKSFLVAHTVAEATNAPSGAWC